MNNTGNRVSKIKSAVMVPAAVALIELAFYIYAFSRQKAGLYLRVAVPLYLVLLIIYAFAKYIKANERIVIWAALLLTVGVFMQVMLIGHLTAENNAAKSIIFDLYQLSRGEDVSLGELTRADASSLIRKLDVDFERADDEGGPITEAWQISSDEASGASLYLKDCEQFPGYGGELEKRTEIRENEAAGILVRNLLFGLAAAVIVTALILLVYGHHYDAVIQALIIVNMLLLLLMLVFGGGVQGDAAKITFLGVQPLELIKLCYLFVLTGLFCKPERKNHRIWHCKRSVLALIYMLVNACFFMLLQELGTLLVLTCTGLCFIFIFCDDRREFLIIFLVHAAAGIAGTVMACTRFTVIGQKLYDRFIYFLNPELDAYGKGYQYIQMRKSLALSGWFGADAPRYKFYIAEEETDVVFVKLIQVSGVILAMLVIVCYIALLMEGYRAAYKAVDLYYRGLAMGISIMLAFQGLVHIACNVGIIPMTGVPLLFISRGGSNQMVSLVITALLLIISTEAMKRSEMDEIRFEEAKGIEKIRKLYR